MIKFIFPFLILLAFVSCNVENDIQEKEKSDVFAVCIWDGAFLKENAASDSKWLRTLALGEVITYLGVEQVDSLSRNKARYYNVELSDQTQGWVTVHGVVLNARGAVLTEKTMLYERPNELTDSEKGFDIGDFIAIKNIQNDWVEVVGAESKAAGWIKNQGVKDTPADVAAALRISKDFGAVSNLKKLDIQTLINYSKDFQFKETFFENYIIQIIEEKTGTTSEPMAVEEVQK